MAAEKAHVTLRFLGETKEALVPAVLEAVRDAVDAGRPGRPALEFGAPGQFGSPRRPRVCWLGFRPGPALDAVVALQARIETAMVALGFEAERRVWAPHLTLGRARQGRGRSKSIEGWMEALEGDETSRLSELPKMRIEDVALYSSELEPEGPIYRSLGRVPLHESGTPRPSMG